MSDFPQYTTVDNDPGAIYCDGILFARIEPTAVPAVSVEAIREAAEGLARAMNAQACSRFLHGQRVIHNGAPGAEEAAKVLAEGGDL